MYENVRYCAKSDVGLRRYNNEDHYLIVDPSSNDDHLKQLGVTFVIADGIGGHAAGEIASRTACEEVISAYYRNDLRPKEHADIHEWKLRKLEKAIRSAHNKIIDQAAENGELRGMGTTLSVLVLTEGKALIGHVGDSRIYRHRSSSSERMTIDHTKNQSLIDTGQILPEDKSNFCYGHILTHALGGYDALTDVFTRIEDVQSGDLFLLCTDGLHGVVTDSEIEGILLKDCQPQTICGELVQAALLKGGDDNVTVIVIQA